MTDDYASPDGSGASGRSRRAAARGGAAVAPVAALCGLGAPRVIDKRTDGERRKRPASPTSGEPSAGSSRPTSDPRLATNHRLRVEAPVVGVDLEQDIRDAHAADVKTAWHRVCGSFCATPARVQAALPHDLVAPST